MSYVSRYNTFPRYTRRYRPYKSRFKRNNPFKQWSPFKRKAVRGFRKKNRYVKRKRNQYKRRYNPKKAMYRIARKVADTAAVQSYRDIDSAQIVGTQNECLYTSFHFMDHDHIEAAVVNMQVKEVNTAAVVNTFASPLSLDGIRLRILGGKRVIKMRNNGTMPCKFIFYKLITKQRLGTADGPTTEISDSLTDMGVTNPLTDQRYFPHDSKQFLQFFKVLKTWYKTLNAGEEYTLQMKISKPFNYSPDQFDRHPGTDKIPWTTQYILARSVGAVSHDSTTHSQVGTCDYTIDYVSTMRIDYSSSLASIHSKYMIEAGSLDAQSVAHVIQPDTEIVGETL